jgi:hypothetical protein
LETILLFSRCELVHLYGRISPFLAKRYRVVHLAYGNEEEHLLRTQYGIVEVINFRAEVGQIHATEKADPALCTEIDQLILTQSQQRFTLNSCIQYDRSFGYTSYTDSLLLAQTYYKYWKELLENQSVSYLLHEPTSLFLNHIAALLCEARTAKYLTAIQVYGNDAYNFLVVTGDNGRCEEILHHLQDPALPETDRQQAMQFLRDFRADSATFLSAYMPTHKSFFSLSVESVKMAISALKRKVRFKFRDRKPIDHLEIFLYEDRSFRRELSRKWGTYFQLKYDTFDPEAAYYYYPIHLEPEAVVLYWGDGLYKNQIKLIENIAAQLPAGCWLYVKDHPHAGAYRDLSDYLKLRSVPNIRLLDPAIPGKSIIQQARGVITINGTSGFEALLLNKQVYTFGNSFYNPCERVQYIRNIRDLQALLYAAGDKAYSDTEELYRFVSAYLKSTHAGFTDYFANYVSMLGIAETDNAATVAENLLEYLRNCRTYNSQVMPADLATSNG